MYSVCIGSYTKQPNETLTASVEGLLNLSMSWNIFLNAKLNAVVSVRAIRSIGTSIGIDKILTIHIPDVKLFFFFYVALDPPGAPDTSARTTAVLL